MLSLHSRVYSTIYDLKNVARLLAIMIILIRFHFLREEGMGKQNDPKIFSLTDTNSRKPHPFLYSQIGREADILKLIGNNIKT